MIESARGVIDTASETWNAICNVQCLQVRTGAQPILDRSWFECSGEVLRLGVTVFHDQPVHVNDANTRSALTVCVPRALSGATGKSWRQQCSCALPLRSPSPPLLHEKLQQSKLSLAHLD